MKWVVPLVFYAHHIKRFWPAGGDLLAPCECRGTLEYVHRRCLCMWVRTVADMKGPIQAVRCDICRAPYHAYTDFLSIAPTTLESRGRLFLYRARCRCSAWWNSLVVRNPHIGSLAKLVKGIASAYAVGCGITNALTQCATIPRVFYQARKDPLQGLAPVVENYISLCAYHVLVRQEAYPQIEHLCMYFSGLVLDLVTESMQTRLTSSHVPYHIWAVAVAFLGLPQSLGMAIQLAELSYVMFLGSILLGYFRGLRNFVTVPLRTMGWTFRWFKGAAGAPLVVAMHALNKVLRVLKHSKACCV